MKILYIHQYFAMPSSGGATRSYEMARRLVQAGHEVTILTSSAFLPQSWSPKKGWNRHDVEGINLEVLRLPYSNKLSFAMRGMRFIQFVVATVLKAMRWSGDLIFATSTPLTVAIPGIFAARKNNVPMVFEVRDLWPEIPIAVGALKNPVFIALARWLELFAYKNAERIIALSQGMAEGIAQRGFPMERIAVIPNGCDIELFRVASEKKEAFLGERPFLRECPIVVYTGTLGYVNGVGYLVEIAKEMRELAPSIRFVIAGDGIEADKIRQRASELDLLDKQLWMLDPLPKQDVAALLSVAHVATSLVIDRPEMWNNSANKVFDALAARCPVMINHRGWQADLLAETGAGIVVPPDNAAQAARQLLGFLRDEEMRETAIQAAADLAETRFNRDDLALQLGAVLEQAVAEAV